MIDLSQFATEEFNVDFNTPVGNVIQMVFAPKASRVVYISAIQIVNNDSVSHDYELQYQGNGVAGPPATFITLTVAAGSSRLLIPADTQAPVEPLIDGALLLVGPCSVTLQDLTPQVDLVSTNIKINWLEGISSVDVPSRTVPNVTQAPP